MQYMTGGDSSSWNALFSYREWTDKRERKWGRDIQYREEGKVNWGWKNWKDSRRINFLSQFFQLEKRFAQQWTNFLAFLEIYELPGPLIFTNTHVWKLFVRSHGHNTSVYSWKAYPDKHVKLWFTPFLKFFYLHLACMTNIQVVDSWPPSIPAGSCPHFASINLTMELKLEPTRQQFFWHYYCTYLL